MVGAISLSSVPLLPMQAAGVQGDLESSVAAAGVQEYNIESDVQVLVEDFDDVPLRGGGPGNSAGADFTINDSDVGTFSGVGWIQEASLYGGAGGQGRHATANAGADNDAILLELSSDSDYLYLGFWWSAGNHPNNVILVEEDGTEVTFSVNGGEYSLLEHVGDCRFDLVRTDYCGNPNYPVGDTFEVNNEPFAFVHLRYEPGFRWVRFEGSGFEFDNVTVSTEVPPRSEDETALGENPPADRVPYELSTAPVLIADPRARSLNFPGVLLSSGTGESDAMLCFSQSDPEGGSLAVEASIEATGDGDGITMLSESNLVAFYGSRESVEEFSSTISLDTIPSGQIFGVNSLYIRVAVTPDNSGTDACTGDDAEFSIVEVRSLNILQSNSLNVSID